jgi:hypothetical protein
MKLTEMNRAAKQVGRYTLTLADDQGAPDYELTITGPRALVEKVFAKSDFEITISPKTNQKEAERRANAIWKKCSSTLVKEVAPAEDIDSLLKSAPKDATAKNSIVVSLRRTRGEGTFFAFWFPLFIPRGVNVFFVTPPASFYCTGSVSPSSLVPGGDADLFLSLNGFSTPPVASGTLSGLATDTVSFIVPVVVIPPGLIIKSPAVVPCYRVFGFSTCYANFFCWQI